MQREGAVGLGYQPKAEQLEEGVTLRLSPLLTFEGDALDAAIELTDEHRPYVPPDPGDRPPRDWRQRERSTYPKSPRPG